MTGVFEAGGSKTEFLFGNSGTFYRREAAGIHPMFMTEAAIENVLDELLAGISPDQMDAVFFYGASCGSHERAEKVVSALEKKFPGAQIQVESDLLGTARALCGKSPGFASIMGTGANACIFDGSKIVRRMVSFGFWLGDEGSGAHLGKKVFRAWLKGVLPPEFEQEAEALFETPASLALQSLLDQDAPNTRMARLGGLAIRNKENPFFHKQISEGLQDFFSENAELISGAVDLPFHFSGSVAYYLQDEISTLLRERNLKPGVFSDRTTERLFQYHTKND